MTSAESKRYPGIAREAGTHGTPDRATRPAAGADKPPGAWTRKVTVYVPAGYVAGTSAVIVGADGPTGCCLRCSTT